MGTRTNYFIQKLLDLVYLNLPFANIGDAAGLPASAANGNLYAALLVDGVEASYTGYARVAIPRGEAGFIRVNNVVTNLPQLNFPKSQGLGTTENNQIAIYDSAVGGNQLHIQALGNKITSTINHQPIIEAGKLSITGS